MNKSTQVYFKQQIKNFKRSFFQTDDLPFKQTFSTKIIRKINDSGNGRHKIYTPLVTLKAFLFQILSDDASCKEAVAKILAGRLQHELPANSLNTGPYCKARQRLVLEHLIEAVCSTGRTLIRRTEQWNWKGFHVVMADGSTVIMPDTLDNQRTFPQQSNQKPGLGFPIARMVTLISLNVGTVLDYAVGAYQGKGTGETTLLSSLLKNLNQGHLLLADRYYCTYAIVSCLLNAKVSVVFRNHANKKTDFRRGIKLGPKDHLIDWYKPPRKPVWMSSTSYAALPEVIRVREFSSAGVVYVTTLIDHERYSKKEVADLYQQRWKIELDLRSIKTHMGMEKLRCLSSEMIKKEIAAYFLAYNLIRTNLAQAAYLHNKNPRELSFKAAIQLVIHSSAQLSQITGVALKNALSYLFKAIASTPIGQRKRDKQPRAVKRRPKAYPLLTTPRHEFY